MDRATEVALVLAIIPALISGAIGVWVLVVSRRETDRRDARLARVGDVEATGRTLGAIAEAFHAVIRRDGQAAEALMRSTETDVHWELLGKDLTLRWWAIEAEIKDLALSSRPMDHALAKRLQDVIGESNRYLRGARDLARHGKLVPDPAFWDDPDIRVEADRKLAEGRELTVAARNHALLSSPWPADEDTSN